MQPEAKANANPFKSKEIGAMRKMKGVFPVMRCSNPFALSGLPPTLENFKKALPKLKVDDSCRIVSEREFISPKACEEYGDYSLTFFGFETYSPPK